MLKTLLLEFIEKKIKTRVKKEKKGSVLCSMERPSQFYRVLFVISPQVFLFL